MLKLRKASIVILAQAHNPSIVSPDWVRKVLLAKEPPSHFVHTPQFSLFDSDSLLLTVDPVRLEVVSKALDEEHIVSCGQVAGAYLRTLPHIPYGSLGLNYIWEHSSEPDGKPLPEVRLAIDGLDLGRVFGGRSIKYSGTIRAPFKPYILTMTIDYEGARTAVLNYNFSYTIESARRAATVTRSFLSLKDRSQQLSEAILAGGSAGNG